MTIRLGKILKEKGMKQVQLVEATGLTPGYVSLIVSGKKTPSMRVLQDIADAIGVTMSEMYEEQDQTIHATPLHLAESEASFTPKSVKQKIETRPKTLETWTVSHNVLALGLLIGDAMEIDISPSSISSGIALINRTDMHSDESLTLIRRVEGETIMPNSPHEPVVQVGGEAVTYSILGWVTSVHRQM